MSVLLLETGMTNLGGQTYHGWSKDQSGVSKVSPREGSRDDAQGQLDPAEDREAGYGGIVGLGAAVMEPMVAAVGGLFLDGQATPETEPNGGKVAEQELLAHAEAGVVGGESTFDALAGERIAGVADNRLEQAVACAVVFEAYSAMRKHFKCETRGAE